MSCFSCFPLNEKKVAKRPNSGERIQQPTNRSQMEAVQTSQPESDNHNGNNNIATQTFTLRELAAITKNFNQECLIGEGDFRRVYKGRLEETNQYMPLGSLEDHLPGLHPQQKPLDWFTRMKIALDAAKGLEYLHNKASPPVIYLFKDPNRYTELADPLLQGNFPMRSLHRAVEVAAMCLNEEPSVRPLISDVVTALSFLRTNSGSQDLAGIGPTDIPSSPQEANGMLLNH
ncbi:hypothetical protein VNO78_15919 [Psophocarpus tetragonolobus]|uniref:Protein kinase domain-containing protein n=1 Tax=Psophocarpus tetragonolobus TaxID=3891 RepID=A0AAN9XJL5_PSOTE